MNNLAQNIYNSRSTLDYDGEHEIVDPGIPNGSSPTGPLQQIIGHWNLLNFSGGASAWATANMTVSGTEIDLVNNHVHIEVGPSKHLQPQDWNAMLQFFRYRWLFGASSVRATGYGDDNNNVDMARNTPDANTVEGLNVQTKLAQLSYATPGDPTSALNGQINSDSDLIGQILAATTPTPVVDAPSMKTMQPREMACCDNTGNFFYAIVHVTAGHTKP